MYRAELLAIKMALERTKLMGIEKVDLYTDSMSCLNTLKRPDRYEEAATIINTMNMWTNWQNLGHYMTILIL